MYESKKVGRIENQERRTKEKWMTRKKHLKKRRKTREVKNDT